ncbi:MAG: DmsC/YnfH family molybdoenzyme membrane anchor subunit [Rhodospirillales bacterium]
MHPAGSVIFFTVASGAGYGVLTFSGVLAALGMLPVHWGAGFAVMLIGLGLVTAGLLSSTFHLGHPERAWRAFSQWRSSWLSREGVAAVVTYGPAAVLGWAWVIEGDPGSAFGRAAGAALALTSLVTIFCTAMIYRSLKPVPAWHNGWTVPGYLVLGLGTGGVVFVAVMTAVSVPLPVVASIAVALCLVGLGIKTGYWQALRDGFPSPTRESAVGIVVGGAVQPLEDPHSSDNYLMKEMGYRVGRKHADKLRRFAAVAGFAAPAILLGLSIPVLSSGLGVGLTLAAAVTTLAGVLVERWLYFAEARHVVMLYYRDRPEIG